MKRYIITGVFIIFGLIAFSQQETKIEKPDPQKKEVKAVPKATQNKTQVKKAQQQNRQVKQAQIKRRQANVAAQRAKAIQRRK